MDLIADAMSYNRFCEVKRYIHFVDNSDQPNTVDKYWKVRPVIDILHESFHAATSTSEHIAIDEMMVPFKGKSYLKQYLKSKPKKWGFKIWVQASTNGYVHCFEMYQGASISKRSEFGPIGDTVINLCHAIHGNNHKLFMDNLFTSVPLLRKLRSFNIYVLGTLRINRVHGIENNLVSDKLMERGSCSIATSDDNITVVRWKDTKLVHTISTYAVAIPEDTTMRYDRKDRKRIEVTRPLSIQEYNKFMGGVDLMDRMIAHYPHGFKNKKWYLRVFFHFLNVSIVNSWIIYREQCSDIPLLNFKASLVWTMLQIGKHSGPKRGRKSLSQTPPTKKRKNVKVPVPEVRYDGINHYPAKTTKKQASRCKDNNCTSRTRYLCKKCDFPVCPECMESYHTKTPVNI